VSIAYTDFLAALRMRESSGNYQVVNPYGYLGAYQFGEGALIDLGYVVNDGNWQNNDYSGGWTGLNGVHSTQDFLNSKVAQDLAADAWFPLMWSYLVGVGADDWLGKTISGISLTASGLIAGAHLLGQHVVLDWLKSGGGVDPVDQFGTPVSEYIGMFNGYLLPFDTGDAALVALADALAPLSGTLQNRVEAAYAAGDRLVLAAEASGTSDLLGTDGREVLLSQDGDDRLVGRAGADALIGQGGDDRIHAGAGADLVLGGSGQDVIRGVWGNDLLYGGSGNDWIAGNAGNDTLIGGTGDDRLFGKSDDDILRGQGGNDRLAGGLGNDQLSGGLGNDVLIGGDGRDVFVFADGGGQDVIVDFKAAQGDRIDLAGLSQITSFSDLARNHARQVGSDVVIFVDAATQLTLGNVDLDTLTARDFLFA